VLLLRRWRLLASLLVVCGSWLSCGQSSVYSTEGAAMIEAILQSIVWGSTAFVIGGLFVYFSLGE